MMSRIFGHDAGGSGSGGKKGKGKAQPTAPKPSLSEKSEELSKKVTDLEVKIAACDKDIHAYAQAQRSGATPSGVASAKNRALQALKRKKMLEQQRDQLLNTTMTVENMAFQQDNMKLTVETVECLQDGVKQMEASLAAVGDLDAIHETFEKMEDLQYDAQEINELMNDACQNAFSLGGMDEGEIDAEFAALEEQIALDGMNQMSGLDGISVPASGGGGAAPSWLPASGAGGGEKAKEGEVHLA